MSHTGHAFFVFAGLIEFAMSEGRKVKRKQLQAGLIRRSGSAGPAN